MKRGVTLLLVSLILVSFMCVVGAEENETSINIEIDSETQEEIEIMDSSIGAEMRLLQLERALKIRILHMEAILEVVKEDINDSSELESIIEEMNMLVEEVQNISVERADQEAVQKFVDVKLDARDLVSRFREIARPLLTEEDVQELRQRFVEIDRDEVQELREKIRERRRELNSQRAKRVLGLMGVNDEELINRIREGEVSPREIRARLKEHYVGLGENRMTEIRERVRDNYIERREFRARSVLRAQEERLDRVSDRLRTRAERLEKAGFVKASERVEIRAKRADAVSDRLRSVRNNIQERRVSNE